MKFITKLIITFLAFFALGITYKCLTFDCYFTQDGELQILSSKENDGSIVTVVACDFEDFLTITYKNGRYELVHVNENFDITLGYKPETKLCFVNIYYNTSMYKDDRKPFAMLLNVENREEYNFIYGWKKAHNNADGYFEVFDKGFTCNLGTLLNIELGSGKSKEIDYIMFDGVYMQVNHINDYFDSATRKTDSGTEMYQLIDGKWTLITVE